MCNYRVRVSDTRQIILLVQEIYVQRQRLLKCGEAL